MGFINILPNEITLHFDIFRFNNHPWRSHKTLYLFNSCTKVAERISKCELEQV